MKSAEIISEYDNGKQVSDKSPDKRFFEFFEENRSRIREIILEIKEMDQNLMGIDMQIGMFSPINSIIDEEIKKLCSIPFRREDGSMFACEGVMENWKGCPPHSPLVSETIEYLKKARGFLIMQFNGISDTVFQKYIHHFTLNVEKRLIEDGNPVLQSYSCGPCRICSNGCNGDGQCRAPSLRRFALESCGFWVNHLCRKASENPIYGNESWEIQWVKDWNLVNQDPSEYKSVTGLLLS